MNNLFPILAVETSGDICSAALMLEENIYVEHNIMRKHIHSEKLLPVIQYLLEEMKTESEDLNTISVSMGPGSFTGLRIGMAAAKGIALGAGSLICPVPTFDAAAYSISSHLRDGEKFTIVTNTNVEEAYLSDYSVTYNGYLKIGETRLVKKNELEDESNPESIVFGDVSSINRIKPIMFNAVNIARWTYIFGKDLLISDFDLLEPNYFKNFIARIKK